MKLLKTLAPVVALAALPTLGMAQEAEAAAAPDINPYIFTTLLFLMGGFLVFWMAAGFAMLEAGLVRSKNVTMQLTKNIALFSIAAIMYWLVGFNLMYPGDGWIVSGYLGTLFSPT
ncbi:MAG: ammonium transporter, partial [Pseudomonadota bacterium]|nr:ammonium transporter [Pseudomonadota bacterium]